MHHQWMTEFVPHLRILTRTFRKKFNFFSISRYRKAFFSLSQLAPDIVKRIFASQKKKKIVSKNPKCVRNSDNHWWHHILELGVGKVRWPSWTNEFTARRLEVYSVKRIAAPYGRFYIRLPPLWTEPLILLSSSRRNSSSKVFSSRLKSKHCRTFVRR